MTFVQIIEFETDRMGEIREMAKQVEQRFADRGDGPTHRLILQDRNTPDRYFVVMEFNSYEEAMRNSSAPETGEFAERMASMCTRGPSFIDCDVLDSTEFK
ncbi:hypothetical protein [Streptomyces resistomycificus]|uniref:ABM domain-containing protein n=1 Tax=Streptomyces resistomycificus TaxID=67356 RepID=A0A0L8L6J5_9ACTN|nr:hypothetical protein [Streptomyces resistomycificus]KOG33686.1 hypothetical protein ADK37_21405 [Streptomyces resistomycificus]KUN93902.1 hypothetical protein AQJ84_28690 [Streptomyces resistomycificus]